LHQTGRRVEEPALFKLSRRCISLDNDEFVRADVDFDLDFFLAMASGAGIAEHSRISFSQRNGSSKGGLLEICENDERRAVRIIVNAVYGPLRKRQRLRLVVTRR